MAGRYRKRGLDPTAQRMVEFLERQGIESATVLEIGGGVGEIGLELLRRGAERAVNLELSPAYDAEAERLAAAAGVAGRVERRLHDIAVDPDAIEAADVVVLHRVVCCYPDYERLLGAAAAHARRLLAFSHPRDGLISRLVVGVENLGFRLARREFRVFAHAPEAMLAVLGAHGLEAVFAEQGFAWEARGLSRR
jgi:magnesium-protoporphyrin O-methyltransferase